MTNEALALLLAVFGGIGIGVVLASAVWRRRVDEQGFIIQELLEEQAQDLADLLNARDQLSKFDHDGDGKPGGSKPRKSH